MAIAFRHISNFVFNLSFILSNLYFILKGCSMFTIYLNLDSYSFPIERICLLQFATALACVRSIIENFGYEVCIFIKFYVQHNPIKSN